LKKRQLKKDKRKKADIKGFPPSREGKVLKKHSMTGKAESGLEKAENLSACERNRSTISDFTANNTSRKITPPQFYRRAEITQRKRSKVFITKAG